MKHDPKLFELHREFKKHFYSVHIGHIHLPNRTDNPNFTVFHTDKRMSTTEEWQYACELVTGRDEIYVSLAVQTQNNSRLTSIYKQYVAAVKAGGYRPKEAA
jgi:hypothetical protein